MKRNKMYYNWDYGASTLFYENGTKETIVVGFKMSHD